MPADIKSCLSEGLINAKPVDVTIFLKDQWFVLIWGMVLGKRNKGEHKAGLSGVHVGWKLYNNNIVNLIQTVDQWFPAEMSTLISKSTESSPLFSSVPLWYMSIFRKPMAADEGMASRTYSKFESKLTSMSAHNKRMLWNCVFAFYRSVCSYISDRGFAFLRLSSSLSFFNFSLFSYPFITLPSQKYLPIYLNCVLIKKMSLCPHKEVDEVVEVYLAWFFDTI